MIIGYKGVRTGKGGNTDTFWIKGEDGLYTSKNSDKKLTVNQILSDLKNGYLIAVHQECKCEKCICYESK